MRATWERMKLWFWAKFFILWVILAISVFRRRMSHNNAVGGRGKLRIVTDQKFPPSDFFEPGREFPCRIRHGAAGYMDDAMSQVRSGSLKFEHQIRKSKTRGGRGRRFDCRPTLRPILPNCRRRQRQALLHWAYDSEKSETVKKTCRIEA